MNNLLIREWLNAALIPLNISIIIIIIHSLIGAYRKNGPGWTNLPGVKSACAMCWIFIAELMRAAMAWSLLNDQNEGRPVEYLGFTATMFYIAAASIASLATFRLIYSLSPDSWGHKGWGASAVITVVFVTLIAMFA